MTLNSKKGCVEMAFGENLKRLRQDKGWTQGDLANRTGLRVATISQLERGEGDPKMSTLHKLLDALECSADALLLDLKHLSLNSVMKTMLERAQQLPEREQAIIIDVIDNYCINQGLNEVVNQGWRKFAIVTRSSVEGSRVLDEIEK